MLLLTRSALWTVTVAKVILTVSRHPGRPARRQCGGGHPTDQSWIARPGRRIPRGLHPGLLRAGGPARARTLGRRAQMADRPPAGCVRQPAAPRRRVAALPA